ncbi:MAG: hypothetical protein RL660_2276 [Bacteroidota bacterium]|jgi:hypothetical protein
MKTEPIYLAGLEVQFYNAQHLCNFILSQRTTEAFAKGGYNNSKLTFQDDKLVKYEFIDEGVATKVLELQSDLVGMPIPHCEEQTPSLIQFAKDGLHTMGGTKPDKFRLPEHNGTSPLVYIGCISKDDYLFSWLPFDLHIAFPIYANVVPLYFDYANPLQPSIINVEQFNKEHSNFEPYITKASIIEFESAKFNFVTSNSFYNEDGNTFGHACLPNFAQTNPLPISPTTGKLMPFVCQLQGGVNMKHCDIMPVEEYYKDQLRNMNFWGDASLAIYFEPETKMMCALISH